MDRIPIKRALISVSDKSGLAELARELVAARRGDLQHRAARGSFFKSNGITSREVADYTAFPEMMHGRVKTLHPKDLRRHSRAAAITPKTSPPAASTASSCSIWSS